MSKFLLLTILALSVTVAAIAQKKRIVVLGSSTAAGFGTDNIDSSWVKRAQAYWGNLIEIDTPIIDLAEGGDDTYNGLPTGFISPLIPDPNVPKRDTAKPGRNITCALDSNPDLIIVNYANNDVGLGYSLAEYMFNLRTIYNMAIAHHIPCYITTTQPRTTYGTPQKELLKEIRDSIMLEFAPYALDFYNPVVGADSLDINPIYAYSGDAIHLNDAGHEQLFEVVKNEVLLSTTPLALSLTGFSAQREQQGILLKWTDRGETGNTDFEIQRSATGQSYEDLQLEKGQGTTSSGNYSWIDDNPLSGGSFYRLKIIEPAKESYSQVVSIGDAAKELSLDKIITNGSQIMAGISTPRSEALLFSVLDRSGALISKQTHMVTAPYSAIPLSLTGIAAGEYFLRISTANGLSVIKPFVRF